jgi:nicotinate-nucleotide--dimethylbenzimidazole phosphoribosyltransferase
MTGTANAFEAAAAAVGELDDGAGRAASEHHDRLTKPRGSLGRVEAIGVRLAAIAGASPPPLPAPAAVAVFAGDHGVLAEGVTPWPQDVTAQMVQNFLAGGAAINVLARQTGARVIVVDVGVATQLDPAPGLAREKVRAGTGNIAREPAMTVAEARQALDVGAAVAGRLVDDGAACLVTGDMGIGNTTPSAALTAAFTGRGAGEVTGRGTGIDDPTLSRKVAAVDAALARTQDRDDPVSVLASLGGLEIAALTGFVVGGAAARVPVVVDGVIAGAALLTAAHLAPGAVQFCFAGHRSTEPAARVILDALGLEPILDLELRLGEGSGACLALPVLEASARILGEMATFDAAGVTDKPD